MAVQTARLCIVSREPFRSARFVAALHALLGFEDDLKIIVDRRHSGSPGVSDLKEDRRRQPHVDVALEAHGFAIVPAVNPAKLSFEVPTERGSQTDDEDRKQLERIRDFLRRRIITRRVRVLSGVASIALVLGLALQPIGPGRLTQLCASPDEPAALPPAATGRGARDATPEPSPTAPPTPAPPRADHLAGASPRGGATVKAAAASHRAELVGGPISRGWGSSYAVRVLDTAGRPLVDASVMLVADMADGSVENVAMGALAEPGTYRGTVPSKRSTPVKLRVRVTTNGGYVEVPLSRSRTTSSSVPGTSTR
jgi:hypothetical protein